MASDSKGLSNEDFFIAVNWILKSDRHVIGLKWNIFIKGFNGNKNLKILLNDVLVEKLFEGHFLSNYRCWKILTAYKKVAKTSKNNFKVILWFWEWEQFYSFFTLRHFSSKVVKKFTLIAVEYKFSILIFNFKIKPQLMIVSMLMMTYVITSSPSQYVEFHSNHEEPNNVSSHHLFFLWQLLKIFHVKWNFYFNTINNN